MKLINAFLAAAFMAAVTCIPVEGQEPASVAVHVEKLPTPPAPQKAGKAYVLSSSKPEDLALLVDSPQSRSVKRDDAFEQSAALTWHMTIWDGKLPVPLWYGKRLIGYQVHTNGAEERPFTTRVSL